MKKKTKEQPGEFDRRNFIRTTAGATAAAATFAGAAKGAAIDPSKKLKVGFIGTGGRGTGAAAQALTADDNIELHVMADVFQDRIDKSLGILQKDKKIADKIAVPSERQFVGLDAYKRVMDSDVDVVILTTTPGFRPLHLRAAVEAGKHIFTEKPMAVDAAGVRHGYETIKMSEGKPFSIVAGFCWRYDLGRVALYKKIREEGMIGDITSIYATYLSGHSKPHLDPSLRTDGMSDIEWQIRNWYNYTWLGGGGLVEQAIHSVDKIGWAMGDKDPIRVRATGGLAAPQVGKGNIFDHYHIAYEYPNNVWCHLSSRKTAGCKNENADYIRGTKGSAIIGVGGDPFIQDNDGKIIWKYRKPRSGVTNMYQIEHNDLFNSIRSGEFINDGPRMTHSTMMGIAGRMSAHTGKEMTWEQAMNAGEDLFPAEENLQWDEKFKPQDVAIPGATKIEGIG